MKKVAIIFGGCSSEYEISLKSAYCILENIAQIKYEIIKIGITKQGEWLRFYGENSAIKDNTWTENMENNKVIFSQNREVKGFVEFFDDGIKEVAVDTVFPILHGKNGEDGTLQGLMQLSGIPFVGCGQLSSAMCMDKEFAHRIVRSKGIKTTSAITISKNQTYDEMLSETRKLNFPIYVKPANSGSSVGITKVLAEKDLATAFDLAFEHDKKIVLEENVEGFEVGCAILGNDDLVIGEVDEIELKCDFLGYDEKYISNKSIIHVPARIDVKLAQIIKEEAIKIYNALECRGFARVDMFLTPQNEIVFNEVNTIPGFTDNSRYPNMLKAVGMSIKDIIDRLIELSWKV